MSPLPQSHNLSGSIVLSDEELTLCQASSKDGKREGPEKLFAVRTSRDGNDIMLAVKLDHRRNVSCNDHGHPLLISGRATQTPAFPNPLGSAAEGSGCAHNCTDGKRNATNVASKSLENCRFSRVNHSGTLRQSSIVSALSPHKRNPLLDLFAHLSPERFKLLDIEAGSGNRIGAESSVCAGKSASGTGLGKLDRIILRQALNDHEVSQDVPREHVLSDNPVRVIHVESPCVEYST